MKTKNRNDVDYMEFRDGYVLVNKTELELMINAYKTRQIRRNELRVFAAMCEEKGLHRRSRVDIPRIVNCKSGMRGIRRLSATAINRAQANIRNVLDSAPKGDSTRRIAVSRRMLRHAAKGGATSNEIIVMLYYCMRRIRQRRCLMRLNDGERYARFTYRELERISGIPRANICRAISRLRAKGFINNVWVKKQNENQFGLLFVDGTLVSLSCPRQREDRREIPTGEEDISTTPASQNNNAPPEESTTLRNDNPKKRYLRISRDANRRTIVTNVSKHSDWERILRRSEQMKSELIEQAA